jgi:nucleosome assembly protein 1-like 1
MSDQAFTFNFGDNTQIAAFQEPTEEDLRKQADETLLKNNPKQVVERVRVLQQLQAEHDDLQAQFDKEVAELERQFEIKYLPLYQRRREIVSGTKDVTEDEKTKAAAKKIQTEATPKEGGNDVRGIPGFWATVLQNSEIAGDMIHEHDGDVLQALQDITFENTTNESGAANGFKLHFHFADNEYFTNSVLSKTFHYDPENDDEPQGSEGTEIQWKEGKNLTVKVTIKKQRHKGGDRVRKVKKEAPQDSFFNFFKTLKPDSVEKQQDSEDEEDENPIDELIEADQEIGDVFRERIIPRAVEYFLGLVDEEQNMDDFFSQMNGMMGGGFGGEDDEEDDEEERPQRGGRGQRGGAQQQVAENPECKQQ